MAENSKIEWTHHTFSPWAGCENDGLRVAAAESYWRSPIEWDREASAAGERRRVFCAPWADVFDAWPGPMVDSLRWPLGYAGGEWKTWSGPIADCPYRSLTMDDVRHRLFRLIDATPNLDWLLLTKRPENVMRMIPGLWQEQLPPNIWLGVSVENQAAADERIPHLLRVPAAVRFLSCEPLLGPVDLMDIPDGDSFLDALASNFASVDWVIVGGESGPKSRPCDVAWIRSIRDQCQAAGVPVFVKQLGANPNEATCGDATTIRLRDPKGDDWSEWPESLRVREFPRRSDDSCSEGR